MADPGVRCAAVRVVGGIIVSMERPARHHTILHALARRGMTPSHGDVEQGFLANNGEFVDRTHAARLCGKTGSLFTEDLW